MNISLSFHIIGFVLWVGGMMIFSRILALCDVLDGSATREKVIGYVRRGFNFLVLPGLSIALASGLFQIMIRGMDYYTKAGWFHGKVSLVVLLFIATFILSSEIKKVSTGGAASRKKLMSVHGLSGLCLVTIVFITLLARG